MNYTSITTVLLESDVARAFEGLQTRRLHVATLMRKIGIKAIFLRTNHTPTARGFVYLCAVVD